MSEELIQGKIHIQQKFEKQPQIFVKQSYRESCNSELSGLDPFDNMTIIHWVKIGEK